MRARSLQVDVWWSLLGLPDPLSRLGGRSIPHCDAAQEGIMEIGQMWMANGHADVDG